MALYGGHAPDLRCTRRRLYGDHLDSASIGLRAFFRSTIDRVGWTKGVGDFVHRGGSRHQLHDTHGASGADTMGKQS